MAKCNKCGKSGLFLTVNRDGICSKCVAQEKRSKAIKEELYRTDPSFRKMTDELKEQDRLLKIALDARERYREDGDCEKAIAAYEKVMLQSDPPLKSHAHTMFLVDLYIKSGQNDKAWGFLNSLTGTDRLPIEKIRGYQAKILKKENKHKEAIEMIMLEYLAKSEWNRTFDRESFVKAIKPSLNKLKLDTTFAEELSDIVQQQVAAGKFSENLVITKYRDLIK